MTRDGEHQLTRMSTRSVKNRTALRKEVVCKMGRKKKERPHTYNKQRLPAGFYVNKQTGKVTRHGEGPSSKKAKKDDPSDNDETSTTLDEMETGWNDGNPPGASEEFTCTTPPRRADEKLAEQRRRELPQDSPIFHFESDTDEVWQFDSNTATF